MHVKKGCHIQNRRTNTGTIYLCLAEYNYFVFTSTLKKNHRQIIMSSDMKLTEFVL